MHTCDQRRGAAEARWGHVGGCSYSVSGGKHYELCAARRRLWGTHCRLGEQWPHPLGARGFHSVDMAKGRSSDLGVRTRGGTPRASVTGEERLDGSRLQGRRWGVNLQGKEERGKRQKEKAVGFRNRRHGVSYVHPMDCIAHQVLLSMGFSRQKYGNGLPCPPPGDLPNPEIEPTSLLSPALEGRFLTTEPPGKPFKQGQSILG